MKRRKFLQNLGFGTAPIVLGQNIKSEDQNNFPVYRHSQPTVLEEAISKEGQIMVRIEFNSDSKIATELKSKLNIKKGKIVRTKSWFFEQDEDEFISDSLQTSISQTNSDTDVLVIWLDEFSNETELTIQSKKEKFSFTLHDLVQNLEEKGQIGQTKISANFLLDKEIGEIDPSDVGINVASDDFLFLIMADPQGGDTSNPDDNRCRMKIHNAFVEESIKLANELKVKPAFCMMLGDIVDQQGEARDFAQMAKFFEKLEMPVLYAMGNHESRYRTTFKPGYNLSGFNNYFAAQKALNGMNKLLYSFNLGKWHFIVWPDPLRQTFWENHPHYFDWLERDLENHKTSPTIFMQHIPMHPIGINPLINYAESVTVKRLLFEILSKYGNVKTIFSGHVHIPVKSSFKTTVSHKGINCINLPAAGYRPRSFGEQDFNGGPSQGFAIVEIKGERLETIYKTVTLEEYKYPEKLPVFESEKYPLWLNYKWELPAKKQFINADFSGGLKNWGRRYVYEEDIHPANICEVRTEPVSGKSCLYMKTQRRGFCTPGQDRLPQDINRIFQAIELEPGKNPILEFEYFLDGETCDFKGWNGSFVWIEGFNKSTHVLNLMYFANKAMVNLGGTYGRTKRSQPILFSLNNIPNKWHKVQVNIKQDFERYAKNQSFLEIQPDRLVLSFGIWNINDGSEQPFAAYFNKSNIAYNKLIESNINDDQISLVPESRKWWRGKNQPSTNIAGEHHYFTEDYNKLKFQLKN